MYQHIKGDLSASDRNWQTVETVRAIADQSGATPSQVALSWVIGRLSVSFTIIGARSLEQLTDNLGVVGLTLDADVRSRLDAVSAPVPDDYPYGRFGVLQRNFYIDSSDQALREL